MAGGNGNGASLANLAPALTRALGSQVFDELVIDSMFSPEVSLEPWAPGDGQPDTPPSPLPGMLAGYVRPRARLMRQGKVIMTFAPFGEPSGTWLPNAVGVISGIAGLTAFMLGFRKTALKLGLVSVAGFAFGYMTRPGQSSLQP